MNAVLVGCAAVRRAVVISLAAFGLLLLAAGPAAAAGEPTWVNDTPPTTATVGEPYSYTYLAQSPPGQPAPTYASSGPLPDGLTLDPASGVLSGTPTKAGDFTFLVVAVNANGPTATPYTTITVARAPQQIPFTSTPPNPATIGSTYQVTATGDGSGNPVLFSLNANSTEGACEVSVSGLVTFTGVGTCIVNANQAGDATYDPATASQRITVSPVPSPSPSTSRPAPGSRPHSSAGSAPDPVTSAAHGQLALTGTGSVGLATLGMALAIAGLALVVASGRRRGQRRP